MNTFPGMTASKLIQTARTDACQLKKLALPEDIPNFTSRPAHAVGAFIVSKNEIRQRWGIRLRMPRERHH